MIEWMDWGLSRKTENLLLNERIATRDEVRALLRRIAWEGDRVWKLGPKTARELWLALDKDQAASDPHCVPAEGTDE